VYLFPSQFLMLNIFYFKTRCIFVFLILFIGNELNNWRTSVKKKRKEKKNLIEKSESHVLIRLLFGLFLLFLLLLSSRCSSCGCSSSSRGSSPSRCSRRSSEVVEVGFHVDAFDGTGEDGGPDGFNILDFGGGENALDFFGLKEILDG